MHYATDLETLEKEVHIETYRSHKPGGQRRDKTETAVRLRHMPSGVTVTASDHRYQALNRRLAFHRLQERLERLNRRPKPRIRTRLPASATRERLQEKREQAQRKQLRREPTPEP